MIWFDSSQCRFYQDQLNIVFYHAQLDDIKNWSVYWQVCKTKWDNMLKEGEYIWNHRTEDRELRDARTYITMFIIVGQLREYEKRTLRLKLDLETNATQHFNYEVSSWFEVLEKERINNMEMNFRRL